MIAVCRNMTSSSRIITEVVAYDVLRQRNRDPELQIARLDACSRGACGDVPERGLRLRGGRCCFGRLRWGFLQPEDSLHQELGERRVFGGHQHRFAGSSRRRAATTFTSPTRMRFLGRSHCGHSRPFRLRPYCGYSLREEEWPCRGQHSLGFDFPTSGSALRSCFSLTRKRSEAERRDRQNARGEDGAAELWGVRCALMGDPQSRDLTRITPASRPSTPKRMR